MTAQLLLLTIKSLRHRPIRSWLTILGIVIGIMLVVIILSLSSGIKSVIAGRLQMFGTDLVVVLPGEESNPLIGLLSGQKFRTDDLLAIEKIPGVKCVDTEELEMLNIEYRGEKQSTLFHTLTDCAVKIMETSQGFQLAEGRWPQSQKTREVVLGSIAARKLFKEQLRLGGEIIVGAKRLTVTGIAKPFGDQMVDSIIFIPLDIFRDITGGGRFARSANVKVMPGANVDLIVRQIKLQLANQSVVRDFTVLTAEKAGRIVDNVLAVVEFVLLAIAFISLIVGAVGIMNTMYTSVLERTKQIGIMKAIGATNDAILALFLLESGMIGIAGGVLGVTLGLVFAALIGVAASAAGINGMFSLASVDYLGLLSILSITFVTGIVSGVLPARQASRLEPMEALRYE